MADQPKKKGSKLFMLLKVFAFLFLALVLLFMGVGLFVLDGKYEFSRSTVIKADPDEVHKHVGDLRKWPAWLPFPKHDPSVKTTIDKPEGLGAHQHWTQNNMFGGESTGELTFTSTNEDKGVEFDMLFDKEYKSKGALIYEKVADGTKVTWKMTGQNDGIIGHWMALMMPSMAGTYFEEGLADLKKAVEEKK